MVLAIQRALADAGLGAHEIDLVCGSSHGGPAHSQVEIDALHAVFHQSHPQVPVVNYNAYFGFVASAAGLLNLLVLTECMKTQTVPAFTGTDSFFDKRMNFVRQPLKLAVRHALLVGATEGGNYYAMVIKG